jgi:hypothetical protein
MATLQPNPRLDGVALDIAVRAWEFAVAMCGLLNDGPELAAGLRKLREAKDCLVIQGLTDSGAIPPLPGELYAPAPGALRARKSYVAARAAPLAERGNDMTTAMEDRLHVAELTGQARRAPAPARVAVTLIAGFFYVIGWIIGGTWRGLAFCAVAARYGYWQGLGLDDGQIAARLAARNPPAPAPEPAR